MLKDLGCALRVRADTSKMRKGWRTFRTWIPRNSGIRHVFPTENVPLVFSFALCMYPVPLLFSEAKFVAFAGMDSSYIRDKRI